MPIGWEILIISLCVCVGALTIVVLGMLRQMAPNIKRISAMNFARANEEGPSIGIKIPDFTALDGNGRPKSGFDLIDPPSVLLFTQAQCGPCEALLNAFGESVPSSLEGLITVVTNEAGKGSLGVLTSSPLIIESSREVQEAFNVRAVPYAIAIDDAGQVRAKAAINTLDQLKQLADLLVQNGSAAGWLGMPQPSVESLGHSH
jgi:hypothetical protein